MNPFQRLPHLYANSTMAQYKGAAFGEQSPHPFAIAGSAYRYLVAALSFLCFRFDLFAWPFALLISACDIGWAFLPKCVAFCFIKISSKWNFCWWA